jgi:hypothetical protein
MFMVAEARKGKAQRPAAGVEAFAVRVVFPKAAARARLQPQKPATLPLAKLIP